MIKDLMRDALLRARADMLNGLGTCTDHHDLPNDHQREFGLIGKLIGVAEDSA
jgi:hypothetical protein